MSWFYHLLPYRLTNILCRFMTGFSWLTQEGFYVSSTKKGPVGPVTFSLATAEFTNSRGFSASRALASPGGSAPASCEIRLFNQSDLPSKVQEKSFDHFSAKSTYMCLWRQRPFVETRMARWALDSHRSFCSGSGWYRISLQRPQKSAETWVLQE